MCTELGHLLFLQLLEQTQGSYSTGPSSILVRKGRGLKSKCRRAVLPPEAPGQGPSCPFQLLGAPGVPRLWLCPSTLPPSSRGLSSVSRLSLHPAEDPPLALGFIHSSKMISFQHL